MFDYAYVRGFTPRLVTDAKNCYNRDIQAGELVRMALERIRVNTEWRPSGDGAKGVLYLDDAVRRMEALLDEW